MKWLANKDMEEARKLCKDKNFNYEMVNEHMEEARKLKEMLEQGISYSQEKCNR